jgi:hypothetical protein
MARRGKKARGRAAEDEAVREFSAKVWSDRALEDHARDPRLVALIREQMRDAGKGAGLDSDAASAVRAKVRRMLVEAGVDRERADRFAEGVSLSAGTIREAIERATAYVATVKRRSDDA